MQSQGHTSLLAGELACVSHIRTALSALPPLTYGCEFLMNLRCLARDPAELVRVVGTNVFGAFATIQAFYPLLKVLLSGLAAYTHDLTSSKKAYVRNVHACYNRRGRSRELARAASRQHIAAFLHIKGTHSGALLLSCLCSAARCNHKRKVRYRSLA